MTAGSVTCDRCQAAAVCFLPGSDELRELFLLEREVHTRAFCLACAVAAGCFVYPAEKLKRAAG